MNYNTNKPPTNTRRIFRVADLPPDRGSAWFRLQKPDAKPRLFMMDKRRRQVMELLISGPVYCASPVRLSDMVHILKREIGLEVETKYYPGNPITGAGAYGVYFLKSDIRKVKNCEVAA